MREKNKKKKEYLSEYRSHVRRVSRIEAELAEVRLMKGNSSVNSDGMPRGNNQSDLSDYVARLDCLEQDLIKERYRRILSYKNISEQIKRLKSENEKDVLFFRYIKGLSWWEIADKMRYSERQILRIHGKALENLKLNKDVSECQ